MSGLLTDLLNRTDHITQHFVFNGYAALVSNCKPLIITLVVIAIALVGWGVMNGWITLSMSELTKRTLTIGFILALALHWDIFTQYVYDVFTKGPNEIASYLVSSLGSFKGQDVYTALEILFQQGVDISNATWKSGSINNWMPFVYSYIIFFMTLFISGLALLELVAAKFGMAIFLVLAPLIIPLFLFKATKEAIFDGWLKHLITFAFIPVFVAATSVMVILLLQDTIGDIHQTIGFKALDLKLLVPYTLGSFVCIGLLWRVSHLAASIAGGISASVTQGMGNFMKDRLSRNKSAKDKDKDQHRMGSSSQMDFPDRSGSNQPSPPQRD